MSGAQHFFLPTPIDENPAANSDRQRLLASTLRGRGLLGEEASVATPECQASLAVFKVEPGDQGLCVDGPLVEKVVEWQHEHVPANLDHAKGG